MKATNFITASNGVITGIHSGDISADLFGTPYYDHEKIEVPRGAGVQVLDKLDFYGPGWERKTDARLIEEGLLPMPRGYVLDGGDLRAMGGEEKIIAGLEPPALGYKVENGAVVEMTDVEKIEAGILPLAPGRVIDGRIVRDMTEKEMLGAGLVTQADIDERVAESNAQELEDRLGALMTAEAMAQAELDAEYAAKRKAKLAGLLAVKKQKGWPLAPVWP